MDHPPYNQNNYHGFDPTNQNTGRYTSLDKVFYSNKKRNSADAMKMNWAGAESSRRLVRSGKYDKNFMDEMVCIGCFREQSEITNWIKMTLTEKEDALIDIEERRKEFIKYE